MVTRPFGQTLWLWRVYRGLTQAQLAKRTKVARTNLSAIERGRREVSLGTLRALAAGLNVRPGALVDGVSPSGHPASARVSREALERIADAVACDRQVTRPDEQAAVEALRALLGHRTLALRRQQGRPRTGPRGALAAWIRLKSLYGRAAIQTLADRVLERQRAHEPTSD